MTTMEALDGLARFAETRNVIDELRTGVTTRLATGGHDPLVFVGKAEPPAIKINHGASPLDIVVVVLDDVGRVITAAAMAKWIARSSRVRAIVTAVAESVSVINRRDSRYDEFRLRSGHEPIDPILLKRWLDRSVDETLESGASDD